jgi:hypothetical protein
MRLTKNDILFFTSLIAAIWFALTGIVWTYCGALFIAYPFGLLSFILWRVLVKREHKKRNKIIPVTLLIGLALSLIVLICYLIWA